MHVFYSLIQQFLKRKISLQINVRINHPDSAFTLVSKDVGCEAFVLLKKQIEMRSTYFTSFFEWAIQYSAVITF